MQWISSHCLFISLLSLYYNKYLLIISSVPTNSPKEFNLLSYLSPRPLLARSSEQFASDLGRSAAIIKYRRNIDGTAARSHRQLRKWGVTIQYKRRPFACTELTLLIRSTTYRPYGWHHFSIKSVYSSNVYSSSVARFYDITGPIVILRHPLCTPPLIFLRINYRLEYRP